MDKVNQSAFPAPIFAVPGNLNNDKILMLGNTQGMTLLDYFAAKAMQSLMVTHGSTLFSDDERSTKAYSQARSMLKARQE